jgi:hypothetical protein
MLNGAKILSEEHISLTNQSVVNHLIRKERYKKFPHGTDYLGVLHRMKHQKQEDPYVRKSIMKENGEYVILCQSKQQSELFFSSTEYQADKTFARTKCREFEINGYSFETGQLTILCRIFTNAEDAEGYELAFRLAFETAEKDMGKRIPWRHLYPISEREDCVKAIILDLHSGQMQGLARYFEEEYGDRGNGEWHFTRIVKFCHVHFLRTITRLQRKGVSEGMSHLDGTNY